MIVDIVAPSSACSEQQLEAGLEVLEEWGFIPRFPADLFGPKGIVAHSDSIRWCHLRDALMREDSRFIWAVRGGYGAIRLLSFLDGFPPPPRQKLLVGFSDITALHAHFVQRWSWSVLYGPTVSMLGDGSLEGSAINDLRRIVQDPAVELEFSHLLPMNPPAREGKEVIQGRLMGGNLKTLQSLLGTDWGSLGSDVILFLEDRAERGYAIDRMLVQMQLAGVFRGVRAVIFGSFTEGREADGTFTGDKIIAEFAASMPFPVLGHLPVGHQATTRSLPLGVEGLINLGTSPRLVIPADWRASF